jgi:hypothetical protein
MALVLRNTKGSKLSSEEMDGNLTYLEGLAQQGGDPFPYTGDATIDGTLNIDFTETLDFIVLNDLNFPTDPVFQVVAKGEAMGFSYIEGGDRLFSGVIDGVSDVFDGFAEIGSKLYVTGFKDNTAGDYIGTQFGRLNFPEVFGGGTQLTATPLQSAFIEGEGETTEYVISATKDDTGYNKFDIGKVYETQEDIVQIGISLSNDTDGITVRSFGQDEIDTLITFQTGFETQLEIKNNGIYLPSIPTSDPNIANMLWNDNGTLKISSGFVPGG